MLDACTRGRGRTVVTSLLADPSAERRVLANANADGTLWRGSRSEAAIVSGVAGIGPLRPDQMAAGLWRRTPPVNQGSALLPLWPVSAPHPLFISERR
jgi:hypothetical protein